MALLIAASLFLLAILLYAHLIHPLVQHPLARLPGPKLYALTKWRLALDEYLGQRTTSIHKLHLAYGPVIRIGPDEVHFSSPSAVRTIYGAGSGFERTGFYGMFDVYGKPNLFTFRSGKAHAERKKLVAAAYSKSNILKIGGWAEGIVEEKVGAFLEFVEREGEGGRIEVFEGLHFFSLDVITTFLYGAQFGGTKSLRGKEEGDRALLGDILDPDRRRLSWFVVHFPGLVRWLYSREGTMGSLVQPLLPMKKPATYSGIRAHALKAMESYRKAREGEKAHLDTDVGRSSWSIIAKLWQYRATGSADTTAGLSDLDIASECADHLLAGIDTTSDSLMFLIWVLSLPENLHHQDALIAEVRLSLTPSDLTSDHQVVKPDAADKLPYLAAVVKETLRLYSALPASEPRSSPTEAVIDGYKIPVGTTVSCSPYSLHQNEAAFPEPLRWDPGRWLPTPSQQSPPQDGSDLKKDYYWPFSSGARMCVGVHLAMAEMTTMIASIYRKYETRAVAEGKGEDKKAAVKTPGFTSRFEVFCDETRLHEVGMEEHVCWIEFKPQQN
ncbi:putative benzoate 4-monooxygenase cytochrome P450 [Polychaeton citri CBS 116435]|uniref:Benzoate 4-monooxygenase cytochrome P450 n=1 Tax=Polychaeton citri CBS 116435 TaxID=1314669 RepID=A0A9P4UVL7_9PEZI|nr:putative benzoate 4-monooxygenase cytochrome P450 [Polychaeton citri CBS 116435]